jgi:hypothetical protein
MKTTVKASVVLAIVALSMLVGEAAARGPANGKVCKVDTVKANATDIYKIAFLGGQLAQVLVIGDGDTDLDLQIYDDMDNLVVQDLGPTDNCTIRFTPRTTGTYTIKVRNLGRVANRYALVVK